MSNALESASLIMYPSGYSDGVLGSLKPTDGSGDFTFTRGSNLSATRVGPNGYIEKGYENLLLQSNSFLTTWTTTRATISGGQSGYDETNDAWLLNSTDPSSSFVLQSVNVSGIKTISIYAKANTANWILMYSAGGSIDSWFDIQNGQLGSKGAGAISTHIETIGNGWYRCSVLLTNNISDFRVYVSNGNNSFLSDVGDSVYIQDAMLNQGLVAYPYIETTTAAVAGGILEDEPRIDFSDGCGHLLLEPSRTNAFPDSEYFDGSFWTKGGNADIENNSAISPEGIKNASKFYGNTTAYTFTRLQGDGAEFRQGRTLSVFAKAGEVSEFLFFSGNLGQGPYFNLNDGSITGYYLGDSSEIDDAYSIDYGNGWYRCVVVFSANSYPRFFNSENQSITFNQIAGNGIYLYGFQAEQDATYPTSYIPTYGVSQTRLGELMSVENLQSNSIFGVNEGTVFVDWEGITNISNSSEVTLRTSSNAEQLRIGQDGNGALYIADRVYGQGGIFTSSGVKRRKIAFKYSAAGGLSVFEDGEKLPSTFANGDYTIDKFTINLGGVLRKAVIGFIDFFPTALSDGECIALTSL